jgi:hypothetical protein
MVTARRASRRYRLATEPNAVDGVAALKVTTLETVGSIKMVSSTIGKISEIATAISAAIEQQGVAGLQGRAIACRPLNVRRLGSLTPAR